MIITNKYIITTDINRDINRIHENNSSILQIVFLLQRFDPERRLSSSVHNSFY